MALEDILRRIHEEAEEEARLIRARGEEEAGRILEEAAREAEKLKGDLAREAAEGVRRDLDIQLSRLRIEKKKEILALKKELLDGLFDSLPLRLQERSPREYAGLLAGLVTDDLSGDPAVLAVGEEDLRRWGGEFPGLVREALRGRFPRWEVREAEAPADFPRGLLLRTGRMAHSLSLDGLLAESRERMEMEAAKVLFSP